MQASLYDTTRLIFFIGVKLDGPKEVFLLGEEDIDEKPDFLSEPDGFLIGEESTMYLFFSAEVEGAERDIKGVVEGRLRVVCEREHDESKAVLLNR